MSNSGRGSISVGLLFFVIESLYLLGLYKPSIITMLLTEKIITLPYAIYISTKDTSQHQIINLSTVPIQFDLLRRGQPLYKGQSCNCQSQSVLYSEVPLYNIHVVLVGNYCNYKFKQTEIDDSIHVEIQT